MNRNYIYDTAEAESDAQDREHQELVNTGLFVTLGEVGEKGFQQAARETYKAGDAILSIWHPVYRDECKRINAEASMETPYSTHAVFYWNDNVLLCRLGVATASFPMTVYEHEQADVIIEATEWATNLGAKTIEILSRDEPTDMSGAYTCDACGEVCTCVPDQKALHDQLVRVIEITDGVGILEDSELLSLQWLADNLYKLYEGDV